MTIFLLGNHLTDEKLIVIQCIVAALGALNFPVITLHSKNALGRKSRFIKLMVDVCCYDKILFVFYKFKKTFV